MRAPRFYKPLDIPGLYFLGPYRYMWKDHEQLRDLYVNVEDRTIYCRYGQGSSHFSYATFESIPKLSTYADKDGFIEGLRRFESLKNTATIEWREVIVHRVTIPTDLHLNDLTKDDAQEWFEEAVYRNPRYFEDGKVKERDFQCIDVMPREEA